MIEENHMVWAKWLRSVPLKWGSGNPPCGGRDQGECGLHDAHHTQSGTLVLCKPDIVEPPLSKR